MQRESRREETRGERNTLTVGVGLRGGRKEPLTPTERLAPRRLEVQMRGNGLQTSISGGPRSLARNVIHLQ